MRAGNSYRPGWFPVAIQALAVLAETDGACSSSNMAHDLHAHAVFVRRILAYLVRAGLVQAREGRDGGYRLARPTEQITLAEVYQVMRVIEAPEDVESPKSMSAQIQAVLEEIGAEAEQHLIELLSHITLASLLERVEMARRDE